MNNYRTTLLSIAFISIALLGIALYLQFFEDMLPCPLCVMQRYAFAAIAIICLVVTWLPRAAVKAGALLAAFASMAGAGIAGWHLYVKAHPTVSCGIDPLETAMNRLPFADWLPFLFKADGLCATEYAPILGLSLPQWTLVWYAIFAVVLLRTALQRNR